jgi:signal peptidase
MAMTNRLGRTVDWGTITTALNLLAVVVILGGIAMFAVFAVPQLVGAERSYVVLSGSMQPTMEPGDVIIVDAVEAEAVEPGQIVTFRESANSVTTHRVVEKVQADGGMALRTKGDDNEEPDQDLVRGQDLVGRVMSVGGTPIVIPYVGQVIETARTEFGVYALVFVPLTLFVLNELYVRLLAGSDDPAVPADPLAAPDGGLPVSVHAHAVAEGTPSLTDAEPSSADPGEPGERTTSQSEVETIVPLRLTLPIAVLAVLVPYSGWMTIAEESTVGAMVFAGGAVLLAILGYVHLRRYRADRTVQPPGALTAGEVSLTLVGLLVLGATSAWFTVTLESVASGMLVAGSAIGFVLLGYVRLRLWWQSRRTSSETAGGDGPTPPVRSGERGT